MCIRNIIVIFLLYDGVSMKAMEMLESCHIDFPSHSV